MTEKKEHSTRKFSYSAYNCALTCQYQYLQKYVLQNDIDENAEDDTLALRVGSAYHSVLEWSQHQRKYYNDEILQKACTEEKLDKEAMYCVLAMVYAYYDLRERTGLIAIAFEVEIGSEEFTGFIDMILLHPSTGKYIISDLKTSSSIKDQLFERLSADAQLNTYAAHNEQLAAILKLNPNDFAGVIYNVVEKPKIVIKQGESAHDYAKRVNTKIKEAFIPASMLNPMAALRDVMRTRELCHTLTETNAVRNRSSCFNYYKPCLWYSKCHSGMYGDCAEKIVVYDKNSATPPPLVDEGDLLL